MLCFFFFQAEDGIRDLTVTGVQTCALPILGEHQGRDRDEHAHAPPPAAGGRGQRRSWRCLHATHRVARGNACSRAFPIGLPHDSHTPYVPASIRSSACSVCSSSSRVLLLSASSCSRSNSLELASASSSPASAAMSLIWAEMCACTSPSSARSAAASFSSSMRSSPSSASVHGASPSRTGSSAALDCAAVIVGSSDHEIRTDNGEYDAPGPPANSFGSRRNRARLPRTHGAPDGFPRPGRQRREALDTTAVSEIGRAPGTVWLCPTVDAGGI